MNRIIFLFLFVCTLCFTSCLNLIEELSLQEDGSGHYAITFDMSAMFRNPEMKGMIESMIQQESGIGAATFNEMDTTFYFTHAPKNVQDKMDDPEFWKKVSMDIKVSELEKKMVAKLNLEFDDIEEIDYLYKNLNKLEEENGNGIGGMMIGSSGLLTQGALFTNAKKKTLERLPTQQPSGEMKSEDLEMVKMFFGTAKYTTIYKLPGKVKKSTIPNGKVNGSTIIAEYPFLDIINGDTQLNGSIKYK